MQPTDYPDSFDIETYNLNDDLIELIGDRDACISYEFESGDRAWGERDSFTVSLFARHDGDEWECLDHLLSDDEVEYLEGLAAKHMAEEIKNWNESFYD